MNREPSKLELFLSPHTIVQYGCVNGGIKSIIKYMERVFRLGTGSKHMSPISESTVDIYEKILELNDYCGILPREVK